MIQSALIFILGVLVAIFVVVLLGPSVWRRAFFLARRQVQADLPLTLSEIRADRDGLRAEFAVTSRKLEMQLKEAIHKSSAHKIELGRQHEELKRIPPLETEIEQLKNGLSESEKAAQVLTTERDTASEKAEIVEAEVERLQIRLAALEDLTDTLRIENATKDTDHGRLLNEMSEMRRDRKDASGRYNEVSTQLTAAQTELKSEKRRSNELQQKLDKLISELSDAQEKLERYKRNDSSVTNVPVDLASENSALRDEMAALAARMVAITADKEGEGSPILTILDKEKKAAAGEEVRPKSLATRIRDLR